MTGDEIGAIGVAALVVVNLVQAWVWFVVTRRMLNTIAALSGHGRDLAQIERATTPRSTKDKPAVVPGIDEGA